MRPKIFYATDILFTDDLARRVPRALQSAAAARLLNRLQNADFIPAVHSKSHSRAVIGVAAANAEGTFLGIDVEWMTPGRPMSAIARTFLTSVPQSLSAAEFYRGWTFFEAHYKAFQCFPPEALVRTFVTDSEDGVALQLGGGIRALQHRIAEDFQLCIVWHHATLDIEVQRIDPVA